MKIEDYLSQCEAYRNVQFGIFLLVIFLILLTIAAWGARNYLGVSPWWTVGLGIFLLATPLGFRIRNWDKQEDKAAALGSRQGSNYYLRYARSTDVVADCFFIILVLVVVLFAFLQGPVQAARVAITGLLIYSAFSLLFKSDLLMFISISIGMGVGIYYFFAFLYSLIGLWISCGILFVGIAFVLFFIQEVLPRVGGFVALFSRATDAVAESAYDPHYKEILEQYQKTGENPYCYYGRVVEDHDQGGNWTILQYNYFYAFNDWRVAAIGFNNHEGDWEAVSVFLKDGNPQPVGVASPSITKVSTGHGSKYQRWQTRRSPTTPWYMSPWVPMLITTSITCHRFPICGSQIRCRNSSPGLTHLCAGSPGREENQPAVWL
jgi:hypothetical protein